MCPICRAKFRSWPCRLISGRSVPLPRYGRVCGLKWRGEVEAVGEVGAVFYHDDAVIDESEEIGGREVLLRFQRARRIEDVERVGIEVAGLDHIGFECAQRRERLGVNTTEKDG